MKCVWWVVLAMVLGGRGGLTRETTPVCPPAAAQNCIVGYDKGYKNLIVSVKGRDVPYKFADGSFFDLKCPLGITLDEPWLPYFEPALRVLEVRLACPPPATSYEASLRALNVTALEPSAVNSQNTTQTPSTYYIILQLDHVKTIDFKVLAATPTIRHLTISNTKLNATDIELLPAGLKRLELKYTEIRYVPAHTLRRLTALVELVVLDDQSVIVEAAGNLSSMLITSPTTLVSLTLPDMLKKLYLTGWAVSHPEPWDSCAALNWLMIFNFAAKTLPDGWLASCGHLRGLVINTSPNLRTLTAGALRGATALKVVKIVGCSLKALPTGLFNDALALRELDLGRNHLFLLPGDLFKRSTSLSTLYLYENELDSSVVDMLGAVTSLSKLDLRLNAALDACPDPRGTDNFTMQGSSQLRKLLNLTVLALSGTATRRVCPDWRQLPRLQVFRFHNTDTARLTYVDLWFNNTVDIGVDLYNMNLSLGRKDYATIAAAPALPSVTLDLVDPLRCDCELYWAAAALRRPDTFFREKNARCEDGRKLIDVPLDEFVCAVSGPCPAGCACSDREDMVLPGRVLRVDCAGVGLRSLPHVNTVADPRTLDLRLAGNRIYRLSPEDLPPELVMLDLRNNLLGLIDDATAKALVSRPDRRVFLANNPLECGYKASTVLAIMREHHDVFPDWAKATCANGTALSVIAQLHSDVGRKEQPRNVTVKVPVVVSGMSGGALAAIVLSVVAIAALVLVLACLSFRRRLQTALPLRLPTATDASEWLYDAFVSFSHADEEIVRELVEQLESGPKPLRLCVHYRDWVPGGWIPAQITTSVRVSRRTLVIVSEAFLRSKLARAEFREAYTAALEDNEPRLILVLLEDPTRLALDVELRGYITSNTYVRWGDPWFWKKLRRALPDPLPAPASGTTPASPLSDPGIELACIGAAHSKPTPSSLFL